MKELTEKQREILLFVSDYTKNIGYPPSLRNIGEHFGFSPKAAFDHVRALTSKGLIVKKPEIPRSILLTEKGRAACVGEISDAKTLHSGLEIALKKTLCPDSPSDASVYIYDKDRGVFVRGQGETEYVAAHKRNEISEIRETCAVIKPGDFGCILVDICSSKPDFDAEFRIRDGRIVRIDMYGNIYKATEWVERFVPAFSEAMGGVGRFHG